MKLTAKVKLQTTPEQHHALLETIERANDVCNQISQVAWETKTFNQFKLHGLLYYSIRQTSGLAAQMTVRCISKVTDAYKLDRKTCRTFNPHGSIAYDDRILRWYVDRQSVSIWTTAGRLTLPFLAGQPQLDLLQYQHGETDLGLVDGQMYLFATCEKETPEAQDVADYLGVDLGIKNIAVDSAGETYAGNHLNNLRKRHAKLRAKLQKKGTKSAKRLLQKRRRKEQRMANNVNHVISKKIVEKAQRHSLGIGLEELTGIRERITVRQAQRRQQSSWAFADLRAKITYKAQLKGIPVILVDPRNTSRQCANCGHIDKANRKSQSSFLCTVCGHSANADCNAAVIIRRRAAVNRPYVSSFTT